MDTSKAYTFLNWAIEDLCQASSRKEFTPLLEADVTAFLYHRLIVRGVPPTSLYCETRVCGADVERRKYDLVVGVLGHKSACIDPTLIVQVKCFQALGLSPQQHRRRFEGLIGEDLPSLVQAATVLPRGRVQLIGDFYSTSMSSGYMSGTWLNEPKAQVVQRIATGSGIRVVWIRPEGKGNLSPHILEDGWTD